MFGTVSVDKITEIGIICIQVADGTKSWITVGLHPSEANKWSADFQNRLSQIVDDLGEKCVGIGETGQISLLNNTSLK